MQSILPTGLPLTRSFRDVLRTSLCFVLILYRRKREYRIVFKAIKNLMPSMSVREIMPDYEAALWRSVHVLGARIQHRGCVFHWNQAVWRKIQRCGRIPQKLRLTLFLSRWFVVDISLVLMQNI
jgi:hypothetical protein